jgi:steroid 5-alpha reductase family enzyme
MALPVIKNALECADYSSTLEPYLYQLRPLPGIVAESLTNLGALKQIYLDTNPAITSIAFSLAIAPIFLVVSEINKNYSQVDRMWSILPSIYNIHYAVYAYLAGLDTTRISAVALASSVWSTRLTYNYWRRGGYSVGSEDYRWELVKDYIGPAAMFVMNVIFISLAQSLLLCIVTIPSYVMLLSERLVDVGALPAWTLGDTIAFSSMLGLVALTAVGDQQQWAFQNAKHEYRRTGKVTSGFHRDEFERGFRTTGLFAYSRKPNYATEQAHWGVLYAWSCVTSGTWYNWTGIGFAAYLALFQASTWLTELLSEQKYPDYKDYRRQVGKFIPTNLSPPKMSKPKAKITAASPNGSPRKDIDAAHARERYNLRG